MLSLLRSGDPSLVELECDRGSVLVAPGLQGRIFCSLEGELVHRLDADALSAPSDTAFNNVGGNSLWPAPEGGPFAFNYVPGTDQWYVQPGINRTPASVIHADHCSVQIEKQIQLTNRKGYAIDLLWRRLVKLLDLPHVANVHGLAALAYQTEDSFVPLGQYETEHVLIAPWSLEQFPGAEGIVAFGKVKDSKHAINFDFYGQPGDRIACTDTHFTFALGGEDRHQIGVTVASSPELIGAFDINRSMLILRRAKESPGVYFNIADNDQPQGPHSAADLFSIFNGGGLGFYELETIGAMNVEDGVFAPSKLTSETTIMKGNLETLRRVLGEQEQMSIDLG
ncbi:MAG: hypothetical protein K1Y02_02590 [Candidatus Hydrogenedentes bacterium]|nr:hypothetical protein [Candidatus Hydrogenedentota bacterium]